MAEMKAIRDGYGEALVELGKRDRNIVVLDADLADSTRSGRFSEVFPERFFNVGVAEQNMVNMAAGLALCGKTVFASSFAIFAAGRAWEQLRNTLAATKANVKIVASHGGVTVGADGFSHQCTEDISIVRTIPNFVVIVPCDWLEAKKAILAAAEIRGPVYIRTSRPKSAQLTAENTPFSIGSAYQMRKGKNVTIFSCGLMLEKALEAANRLAKEGIESAVWNMHTIKPLDTNAVVDAARKTGALVTVEEHSIIGGLGSAVAEVVVRECPVPVEMVGVRDQFGQSGEPEELLRKFSLDPLDICKAVKRAASRK